MVVMVAGFLIFLMMNFLVIFNSYLILKNFKIGNPEDKFLALGVVTVSQIILILLFLGLIKILYLVNVVLLSFLLTTILVLFNSLKTQRLFVSELILDLKGFRRAIKVEIKHLKKLDFAVRLSLLILIFTLFMIILSGLTTPPYSDDGLSYHLPMAVNWLKSGAVYLVRITTFGDINVSMFYPGNSELMVLWNMLPFYDDIIADLSQLIFTILGALACYGIARKIKIKKEDALWAPILFLLSPVIILQSKTTYNDVIFASMFLVAINFLLSYRKTNRKLDIVLSALSFGVVLGTKYLGITYFFVYILFFILVYPKKKLSKKMIFDVLTIILFISLLAGYWYIRNFLSAGSVIYPMGINLFGYTIMEGPHNPLTIYSWVEGKYVSSELGWLVYPFLDGHKTHLKYSYETGLGPQFISLMIPSIIFIFLSFFIKNREKFFLLFPILLLLFFLTPVKVPRYYLSLLGIGSVAASYCISKVKYSKIIKTITVLCIIFSVFFSLPSLFPNGRIALKAQNKYDIWPYGYSPYAEGWKWLNDHTTGDNIVGITHFIHPLYGEGLKNNVIFIPSEDIYYDKIPGKSWSEYYNEWVELLKHYQIKYIVIAAYPEHGDLIRERAFIEDLNLHLVYEKELVSIYSTENLVD